MINGAFEGTGVTRHESSSIDEFGLADFFIEGYRVVVKRVALRLARAIHPRASWATECERFAVAYGLTPRARGRRHWRRVWR